MLGIITVIVILRVLTIPQDVYVDVEKLPFHRNWDSWGKVNLHIVNVSGETAIGIVVRGIDDGRSFGNLGKLKEKINFFTLILKENRSLEFDSDRGMRM